MYFKCKNKRLLLYFPDYMTHWSISHICPKIGCEESVMSVDGAPLVVIDDMTYLFDLKVALKYRSDQPNY